MSHILRLPAILVLFALMALSALGALAAAGSITGYVAPVAEVQQVQAEAADSAAGATWLDVGLFAAAALFFMISAVRLIRRTQGFWTWLFGFACFGGRWAWAQQEGGGDLLATIQSVDLSVYSNPQALIGDLSTTEGQLGLMAVILIVGIIVFLVDGMDRSYWEKQGA